MRLKFGENNYGFKMVEASQLQTHIMTNQEITQADMLDILFEHRNKAYGAYSLRREYNGRLLKALITGLGTVVLFTLMATVSHTTGSNNPAAKDDNMVVLRTVDIPMPVKKDEVVIKKTPAPVSPKKQTAAHIKYTSVVKIVPDKKLPQTEIPKNTELDSLAIATTSGKGEKGQAQPFIPALPAGNTGSGNGKGDEQPDFRAVEKEPEFPGGQAALQKFLSLNLGAPEELAAGEKKLVQIRFKVDKDGSVNTFQIVTSGGDEYDKEVVRVCRKMPRWIPALQNGTNVPVSYMLPVTFIGVEQ